MRTWCTVTIFSCVILALHAQYVCWQAILKCQQEADCELAYNQYLAACGANIQGNRRQCPSHCISALVRLNQTRNGSDLETCDCGQDVQCRRAKLAIEPCLPRIYQGDAAGMGCTEARQRCEVDPDCHSTLTAYLSNCGQLFNGRGCTPRCRSTIQRMLFIPNGILLDRCVCDGVERPFCEVVKENMGKLCFTQNHGVSTVYVDKDSVYEDEDPELDIVTERIYAEPDVSESRSSKIFPCAFLHIILLMILHETIPL